MQEVVPEKILDSRIVKERTGDRKEYLVIYSDSTAEWEPKGNLGECQKLINEFEQQRGGVLWRIPKTEQQQIKEIIKVDKPVEVPPPQRPVQGDSQFESQSPKKKRGRRKVVEPLKPANHPKEEIFYEDETPEKA